MFNTIELRLTYFLSKPRNENMSNEVSHSDLCYSLSRLIQIKIPSATVYFPFCMLQFSVIASFPGPVQQMTAIWVGLGTWLGLQEDKVGLCYFQGHGMAKVS